MYQSSSIPLLVIILVCLNAIYVHSELRSPYIFLDVGALRSRQDDLPSTIEKAPTDKTSTQFRGGAGVFGAPRADGKTHSGVDIVANQSSTDKNLYRVMAVKGGTVAYARTNGAAAEGYGYTLVVDHGDGFYSLYAHLATNASKDLVKLGDNITAGQVIGYMFDPETGETSSGNAQSESVAAWDRMQIHFELIKAPKGRTSTGGLGPIKADATVVDPTSRLRDFGYH